MNGKKSISISSDIIDSITKRIEKSNHEFTSVEGYIEFVLKQILEMDHSEIYSKDEEEEIRKHLKDMGYI